MARSLFDKVWDAHVVQTTESGAHILYIDRHYIHEVTSPQAFDVLRQKQVPMRHASKTTATADHNVPTWNQHLPIADPLSRQQVSLLEANCLEFDVPYFGLLHENQGIVHVIGPELGLTRPGMTMVCGDSHTSTHGAFGCVAFGIGTSQVAQVFATQCVLLNKPKTMCITVDGELGKGVLAKDIILYIISKLGTGGGTGYFVEYAGSAMRSLSMEGRMTVCNMSIEMGARGGLIAPDKTTFDYLQGREHAPEDWDKAVEFWSTLPSDEDATFDAEHTFDAADITPMVTYGTNPGMGMKVRDRIPESSNGASKALDYMGFQVGEQLQGKAIDQVFIGSCTNSRIEDLRAVAEFVGTRKVAESVRAMIIPGSMRVRQQAIHEGLHTRLTEAGFEFREPGCSACLGMNEDKVPRGAYCVSTSNRNFEGRQGPGARTILASPLTAAAAAIEGKIVDVREML